MIYVDFKCMFLSSSFFFFFFVCRELKQITIKIFAPINFSTPNLPNGKTLTKNTMNLVEISFSFLFFSLCFSFSPFYNNDNYFVSFLLFLGYFFFLLVMFMNVDVLIKTDKKKMGAHPT